MSALHGSVLCTALLSLGLVSHPCSDIDGGGMYAPMLRFTCRGLALCALKKCLDSRSIEVVFSPQKGCCSQEE